MTFQINHSDELDRLTKMGLRRLNMVCEWTSRTPKWEVPWLEEGGVDHRRSDLIIEVHGNAGIKAVVHVELKAFPKTAQEEVGKINMYRKLIQRQYGHVPVTSIFVTYKWLPKEYVTYLQQSGVLWDRMQPPPNFNQTGFPTDTELLRWRVDKCKEIIKRGDEMNRQNIRIINTYGEPMESILTDSALQIAHYELDVEGYVPPKNTITCPNNHNHLCDSYGYPNELNACQNNYDSEKHYCEKCGLIF